MQKAEIPKHVYIGDGVYAEFDGFGLWIRTGDHRDELCENKVYLEPDILASLNEFYNAHVGQKNE